MVSELRNISLSIEFRIWQILRQMGWHSQKTNWPLVKVTEEGVAAETYGKVNGNPWVFINPSLMPEENNIVIKANGVVVPRNQYSIDFRKGRITFNSPKTEPITANVLVSVVNVRKGYPDDEWLDKSDLPVVAYSIEGFSGDPIGIGTALQDRHKFITVDILARNDGELMDLSDDLARHLARIDMLNLGAHNVLTDQGGLDLQFNYADQVVETLRQGQKPVGSNIPPRVNGHAKEKWRALITLQVDRVS